MLRYQSDITLLLLRYTIQVICNIALYKVASVVTLHAKCHRDTVTLQVRHNNALMSRQTLFTISIDVDDLFLYN